MEDMSRLEALGRHLAEEQDRALEHSAAPTGGADRLARAWSPRRERPRARPWAPLAAAAAVVVAFALWMRSGSPDPLRFSIGADARPGQVGALLEARAEGPLSARFSDGSRFTLGPSTRARVQSLRPNGADLVLEGGTIRSEVRPAGAHLWRLSVGPFTVLVTGTRFDTRWVPDTDQFELNLYQGKLSVSGCGIEKQLEIRAGETVRASCRPLHYEVSRTAPGTEASWPKDQSVASPPSPGTKEQLVASNAAAPAPAPSEAEVPHETRGAGPSSTTRHAEAALDPTEAVRASWRSLLRANRYGDAVEAASAIGFESECEQASLEELKALGDAAYFSNKTAKAEFAYGAIRRRFAGSPQAATAAYSLGRLDFDMRGAYSKAEQWFRTYLMESPNGALAREALGRLMEAQQRSGDVARARETATRYLSLYPGGPHAKLAQRLTEAE